MSTLGPQIDNPTQPPYDFSVGEDSLLFGVDDKGDNESLVVSEVCMVYCGHGGKWVYEDGKWRRKWGRRSLGNTPPFLTR